VSQYTHARMMRISELARPCSTANVQELFNGPGAWRGICAVMGLL
jgi:hypothetical protein